MTTPTTLPLERVLETLDVDSFELEGLLRKAIGERLSAITRELTEVGTELDEEEMRGRFDGVLRLAETAGLCALHWQREYRDEQEA